MILTIFSDKNKILEERNIGCSVAACQMEQAEKQNGGQQP